MNNIRFWEMICNHIKDDIDTDLQRNDIENAISKISVVEVLSSMNAEFLDQRLESQINSISRNLFTTSPTYNPIHKNVVFCDSMMWDFHGLTQQYLRALMALEYNILYIKTSVSSHPSDNIEKELSDYGKYSIIKFSKKQRNIERVKQIYEAIVVNRPELILIHSFSVFDAIALLPFESTPRYRVNLGNHLSWIGVSCTDYLIDFNNWGYTISIQKRGFDKEKIYKLPFYPIDSEYPFEGFPSSVTDDRVVMFSGGATYKIIDDNSTFLHLVRRLLIENPSLVFLYAARDSDQYLINFIEKYNLKDRFILIGYRSDINEVIKHIDIYLQTYPIGGGLMEKYAIINKKPILAYVKPERLSFDLQVDDRPIVVGSDSYKKAYADQEEFCREANKLISDSSYRHSVGADLHKYCITPEIFNMEFHNIINNSKDKLAFKNQVVTVDYQGLRKEYNENCITNINSYILTLLSVYRFKTLIKFRSLIIHYPKHFISSIGNYIGKRIKRVF